MSDPRNMTPEGLADRAREAEAAGRYLEAADLWIAARVASAGHGRRARYQAAADRCRQLEAAQCEEMERERHESEMHELERREIEREQGGDK